MHFNQYQAQAQRTSATEGFKDKLTNGILGLVGEAGECADAVKKYFFQGHPSCTQKLIEEMGDVLWYIAEICTALDISMEIVVEKNIKKLRLRYPDGFDSERSIHREV